MSLLKAAASILIVAAGAAAFFLFVFVPYDCNAVEHDVTMRSDRAMRYGDPLFRLPLARHNLELLDRCRNRYPTVSLLMLDGWNRNMIEDFAGAEHSYDAAIALGPRAETFVELGLTQMSEGKNDAAFQSLLTAGAFDVSYVLDLQYPAMRKDLVDELKTPAAHAQVLRRWKKDCAQ